MGEIFSLASAEMDIFSSAALLRVHMTIPPRRKVLDGGEFWYQSTAMPLCARMQGGLVQPCPPIPRLRMVRHPFRW